MLIVEGAVATSYYSPLAIWRQTNKLRFHCPLRFVSKYNPVEHETVLLQATSKFNKMFNIPEICFVYLKLLILLGGGWSQELKNEQFREILRLFQQSVRTALSIYLHIDPKTLFGSEFKGDKFKIIHRLSNTA
jgi:hypothetical protein